MQEPNTPLTYTEPTERRNRANSHFCEAVGSTRYCLKSKCPYCGDENEEEEEDSSEE